MAKLSSRNTLSVVFYFLLGKLSTSQEREKAMFIQYFRWQIILIAIIMMRWFLLYIAAIIPQLELIVPWTSFLFLDFLKFVSVGLLWSH